MLALFCSFLLRPSELALQHAVNTVVLLLLSAHVLYTHMLCLLHITHNSYIQKVSESTEGPAKAVTPANQPVERSQNKK